MRTRLMNYTHYGISRERAEELLELAKKDENEELVRIATEQAKPELATMLFESLKKGTSYDRLYFKYYLPITADDFYAYRRRAVFIFEMLLKLQQLYKTKSLCG